jgi:hypothetical protein
MVVWAPMSVYVNKLAGRRKKRASVPDLRSAAARR